MINYYNNTYKKISISKLISKDNSNKYLNIDLTNYIKPIDLSSFRILFIDIYTKNVLLYFSGRSILNAPYINLKFNKLKNSYNFNNNYNTIPYYFKNDNIDISNKNRLPKKYSESPLNNDSNTNKISDIVPRQNKALPSSPYKSIDIRKLLYKHKKINLALL